MDPNLALEVVRVTEAAALAAARHIETIHRFTRPPDYGS